MRRTLTVVVAGVAMAAILVGGLPPPRLTLAAETGSTAGDTDAQAAGPVVSLTAARPSDDVVGVPVLAADRPAATGTLRLRIEAIDNPGLVPFGIVALALGPGGTDPVEIGRIGIFPPDRTGDYLLSLDGPETRSLTQGALRLSVDPMAGVVPPDLRVSVRPALLLTAP